MLGAMDIFTEAVNLAQRYEKGDAFRFHVRERLALVVMLAHGQATARAPWIAKLRLGKPPPIPWIAAAVLILIPLLVLAAASLKTALLVLAAAILTPVVYALLDAQQRG